ncbi:FAD:protein FMN transferase [Aquirufa sp. KTFRIE-69F]|uniref:FAD:protein FMN transferase n=1 Tax=Aquirufa originis TaxID=3096514 RepID=A0ABW6D5N0_9BACT
MPLVQRTEILMGNRFDIGVVSSVIEQAEQAIEKSIAEIKRIEALLTTFSDDSQTNQINQNAGIKPVKVDKEVYALIERAGRISELTQGAFDLSYGSLDKSLWNFDQKMTQLPSAELAFKAVGLIDYRNIVLEEGTVFLREKGMRIGFGGIGKGYAADRAKQVLQAEGFENGVVNASGDMHAWGVKEDGKCWTVGISNPDSPKEIIAEFDLKNAAVATSGNYEKFVWIDGVKYSHTIHPKTGFPIRGIKSVTVFAPFAELADALTTPIAVMGVEVGLDLINQLAGVACLMISDENVIYSSDSIRA